MKNSLLITLSLLLGNMCFAQVGINTDSPKATLDVAAKTTDGSNPEGLMAPKLTGNQIKAADLQYGTNQIGMIVYATAPVTGPTTKTANILAEGYYYFDGNVWQKFNIVGEGNPDINIYKDNGTLTGQRTINTDGKGFRFKGAGKIYTDAALLVGGAIPGGRVTLHPGGAGNSGVVNFYNTTGNRLGYLGWGTTNFSYATENGANHFFNGGNVGIGMNDPLNKLVVRGNGTNPPLQLENLLSQPATGNYNGLSVDASGQIYKSPQAESPFYSQRYILNNVNLDWVDNFNTQIPTSKYMLVVIGFSYDTMLMIDNFTAYNVRNNFGPANVYARESAGTWRLTADYYEAETPGGANGSWTINTLIMDKSKVVKISDVTVDLAGSNSGAASVSPVP